MKYTIVLYPAPSVSQLVSMVELGKLILHHYHHLFSITVLIPTTPLHNPSTTSYIHRISQTNPSIVFHHLPSLPPHKSNLNPVAAAFESIRRNIPNVHHALQTISTSSTIPAFITSTSFSDYSDLKIPTYYFFSSGASALAAILYLPTTHDLFTKSFKDIPATPLHIPGLPPILASHMPQPLLDRSNPAYNEFLQLATHLPKAQGIIVNTFESLEPRALKAIADRLPVYGVGPMTANAQDRTHASGNDLGNGAECLSWLDAQPKQSVVFLCFGSQGKFSTPQLKEIATGLERSGHRFLWVVRSGEDSEFGSLLPEGFLDRTREKGLVVKSWAPQAAVLSRESVAGFVTHCGWNSILEAVCAGVPMVAWPLYAEQHLNRVILVEEMKVAMAMEEGEDGLVSAVEIEKRLRALMDLEEGTILRERCMQTREAALATWAEGGSSVVALNQLAELWKGG
ncbi:anthocyanidin 5,3-O-glucosyltransferase-like [Macadamia integrifolia]|uniref:anthocyanidin 5,3-O-glucosyltransferase-like n=1 Tax=Macadamia integrifolia TaxID=60698 RepID=UPI001C4F0C0B|nr:anthocyanidin 5,3-O-glucosyltransferase-like [Macadamia integrifolia]